MLQIRPWNSKHQLSRLQLSTRHGEQKMIWLVRVTPSAIDIGQDFVEQVPRYHKCRERHGVGNVRGITHHDGASCSGQERT